MEQSSKYQLIARVGEGGMADVFLALAHGAHGFDKLVILKRLRPMLAADIAFREMFIDEARIAGLLSHPNIVQTLEVGEYDGAFIIAMEYLEGQPLDRVVREVKDAGSQLSPLVCARIVSDVLAGLHYAHELEDYAGRTLEIVHRDVSPQNVFVTYDGVIKLLDFGVAKAKSRVSTTEVGTIKGKTGYMAPEQAEGGEIDRRADLFAVGVMLWEMLTLDRLFPGAMRGPVPPLPPSVPAPLRSIVQRATRTPRSERFRTAADMRQALEAFIGAVPRHARTDDLPRLITTLFHEEREQRRQQIKKRVAAGVPPDSESRWDALRVLGADGATLVDRPLSRPDGTGRTGGNLASDVRAAEEDPTRLRPPSSRPPPTTGVTRRSRIAWPLLLGALVAGGLAAVVIVPRWQARTAPAAVATSAPVAPAEPMLRLCGSYTIATELAPRLVEAYLRSKEATEVTHRRVPGEWRWTSSGEVPGRHALAVDIAGDSSTSGFEQLAAGRCDVAMASRGITAAEAERLRAAGLGDMTSPANEHVLGIEGIAVVIHPNNPVRHLDLEQLRRLFSGELADWSTVGGPPGPVRLHARDDESATWETFKQLVLGETPLGASQRHPINDALADAVASDTSALGFVGFGDVRGAKTVAVSEAGSGPVFPSRFTVGTEEYPLVRRFHLYTTDRPLPGARELVSLALSPKGQALVKAAGYVDLDVWMREGDDPCREGCPSGYAELVSRARRLSLALRFKSGEVDLDSRAQRDLDRVVAFLATLPTARVLAIGFADDQEAPKGDVALSRERAKKVGQELAARGVHAAAVEGFGSKKPIAPGGGESTRARNRRVELWVETAR
jgi:serine/threonine protein kinase/ABC-type phosphate transport system substrate-binding protein